MDKKLPYVFRKYKNYREEINPDISRKEWKILKDNYRKANDAFYLHNAMQNMPGTELETVNVSPIYSNYRIPDLTYIGSGRKEKNKPFQQKYAEVQDQFENTYKNYIGALMHSGVSEEDADEKFWTDYYPNSEMKQLDNIINARKEAGFVPAPVSGGQIESVSPLLSYVFPPTATLKFASDMVGDVLSGNSSLNDVVSDAVLMASPGFLGKVKNAALGSIKGFSKGWNEAEKQIQKEISEDAAKQVKSKKPKHNVSDKPAYLTDDNVSKITYAQDRLGPSGFYNSGDAYNSKGFLGKMWERSTKGRVSSVVYGRKSDFENIDLKFTEKKPAKNTREFKKSVKAGYGMDNPKAEDFYKLNVSDLLRERTPEFQNSEIKNGILKQLSTYKSNRGKQKIPVYYNPRNVKQYGLFPNYVTGRYHTDNWAKNILRTGTKPLLYASTPFVLNPIVSGIGFLKNRSNYRNSLYDVTSSPDYALYLNQLDSLSENDRINMDKAIVNAQNFITTEDYNEMTEEERNFYDEFLNQRQMWINRFGDARGFDAHLQLLDLQFGNKPYDYKPITKKINDWQKETFN